MTKPLIALPCTAQELENTLHAVCDHDGEGRRRKVNRLLETIKHWYQRNFGHVYLTQTKFNGQTECWRFRAKFGRVALSWWATPFVCRLSPNGDIINITYKCMRGYEKPFPGWKWSYVPTLNDTKNGGAW